MNFSQNWGQRVQCFAMCLSKNKQIVKVFNEKNSKTRKLRKKFRAPDENRTHDPPSTCSDALTTELLENRIYYYNNDLLIPVNKSVAVRFRIKMLLGLERRSRRLQITKHSRRLPRKARTAMLPNIPLYSSLKISIIPVLLKWSFINLTRIVPKHTFLTSVFLFHLL